MYIRINKIFLLTASLFAFACNRDANPDFPPLGQPRLYLFLLNIQDVSGIEKIKGLPLTDSIQGNDGILSGTTKLDALKYSVVMPRSCSNPNLVEAVWDRGLSLYRRNDGHYYLELLCGSSSLCPPVEVILQKITSQHIFGDNEEHIIVSYWKPQKTVRNTLYRVEVDGKEFPVTQEKMDGSNTDIYTAWIVLDKELLNNR